MTAPTSTGAPAGSLGEIRSARRELRTERAAVLHWRRLVRARLDLAIASTVPVEPLGLLRAELLPEGAGVEVPVHSELVSAVLVEAPAREVQQLSQLRALDERLRRYEEALDGALRALTDAFVEDLASDPAICLDVLEEQLRDAGSDRSETVAGGPGGARSAGAGTAD